MDTSPEPVVLSWSGGKDSALALHTLRGDPRFEVVGLLTTVTSGYERISVHGVRRALLESQAERLALPLTTAEIPPVSDNGVYEARMGEALATLRGSGVSTIAFGDLFLEDVRAYREAMLATAGMRAIFPLWGRDTTELAREFIDLGFRAVAACVDTTALGGTFAGRDYDATFLADLPASVDPCGENGEFHTFVSAGPLFPAPIPYALGDLVLRDERFAYRDLLEVEVTG